MMLKLELCFRKKLHRKIEIAKYQNIVFFTLFVINKCLSEHKMHLLNIKQYQPQTFEC